MFIIINYCLIKEFSIVWLLFWILFFIVYVIIDLKGVVIGFFYRMDYFCGISLNVLNSILYR